MKFRKICGIVLGFIFLFSSHAFAASYEIDPAHSSVSFKIRHLVGNVRGEFDKFSGTVEYDENSEAASSVKVSIAASSINTKNENRDKHLKSPDFFDTEKFSEITFVSKKIDPVKKKITGDLTMHGVTKEIEIDYTIGGIAEDPRGRKHLGGSGQVTLNRNEFGILYDPMGAMVGREVKVELEIEALLK